MPRLDSSSEGSPSDTESDSSVHTIPNDPPLLTSFQGPVDDLEPSYDLGFFVSNTEPAPSALRQTTHVVRKLANKAKRASDTSRDSPSYPNKTPKHSGRQSASTSQYSGLDIQLDEVSEYSFDENTHEPITKEEDERSYSAFAAAPVAPIHPAFPRTAIDMFRQIFPTLPLNRSDLNNPVTNVLANAVVKQVPGLRRGFKVSKAQNLGSYLIQATGTILSGEDRCFKCSRGTGVYSECVVSDNPDVVYHSQGACGNCWYNRKGSSCSFRQTDAPDDGGEPAVMNPWAAGAAKSHQRTATPSDDGGDGHSPRQPPPTQSGYGGYGLNDYLSQQQTPAPKLETKLPNYRRPPATNTTPTTPAQAIDSSPPAPSGPSTSSDTLDSRVKAWESRYSGMATSTLLSTQEHLINWQEDLITRQLAMNKVMQARLKDKENL
ncbi:hypothetical protein B0H63DRAFT_474834 [Podospora didyma]|uniref:Uncharacterized protein n=1 Tax=Podospora didyma TaxID=330526 RepID=A0AAE0TVG7_9PEZI|nr:hypothetical protein B0H63DRAFT_474834 [Podospora didyma]